MKRTVISYKKLDQHKVQIIGFENVANKDMIRAELGHSGANDYFMGVNYYSWMDGILIKRNESYDHIYHIARIDKGNIMTSVKFWRLVNIMKSAGNRYSSIRVESMPVQEVKI